MNAISYVPGAGAPLADHPEYQELCALFSVGALDADEVDRLDEHLSWCSDCRSYLEHFTETSFAAMAGLAPTQAPEVSTEDSFDVNRAKTRLFDGISGEQGDGSFSSGPRVNLALAKVPAEPKDGAMRSHPPVLAIKRTFTQYLPYAAGFLLAVGLSLTIYWNGPRRQADEIKTTADRAQNDAATSREEVKALVQHRDALNARLLDQANALSRLQNQIAQLQRRISELEVDKGKAADYERRLAAAKNDLAKSLQESQTTIADLQRELAASRQQRTSDSLKAADLERRVEQLTASLKDEKQRIEQQDAALDQQSDLLAHDRDIRDLMGARQLYVAEVYDSDENGKPRKPYARVFYTRDKSLIFYGFDLDKQPGLRNAAAFQVWGRRGANRENALNLGILFQDSSTNKRWILKIDDPMKLQQIDAVFVTIEPKGGSSKPTGKPLLFAYLRIDPNHP